MQLHVQYMCYMCIRIIIIGTILSISSDLAREGLNQTCPYYMNIGIILYLYVVLHVPVCSITCTCMYLGGGLGGTRKGAPNECIKYSGRVDER